jgi:uncharacterized membrane protein YeaQ/YmgE (transglycosylase-associated protein family)
MARHRCWHAMPLVSAGRCGNEPMSCACNATAIRYIQTNNAKEEPVMGILSWIVMGLIVGVLAKFIMPGRDPGGFIITVALGIGGAFVGGYIGSFLGIGTVSGFNMASIFVATLGAIVLLALYRALKR